MNMFNALKRKQLDDRRSEDKEPSVFEETAEDYNTDSYAPVSIQLKHLHRKFAESMDLSLPDNAIPMTGEIAERMLKDFFLASRRHLRIGKQAEMERRTSPTAVRKFVCF